MLITNQCNEFFVNVGPNLGEKFSNVTGGFRKYLKGDYFDSMFLHDTTSDEVNRIIEKLDCKTSCSIDQISSKVVKYVAPYIPIPLSHIFNLTFATGSSPDQLKIALVTPVYKSSDKNIFSNYRPIAVLPCFSKVLEKLMYERIIAYIDKNRILIDRQYGFRSKSSTNHAIIDLVDKITKAIENNEYTVGIFLDLSKAFDTVNHDILLTKLDFCGIRGNCHASQKDYLTNRKQIIKYNHTRSVQMSITCGVPQGSVLGTLLFLIYINDLVNSANKLSTILFADDANLFYSGKNIGTIEYSLNNELTRIQEWLTSNQLTLNIKKTNFIIFKSHRKRVNRQINIKLNNEILQRV